MLYFVAKNIMSAARWWLRLQALFWRALMRLGMFFHNIHSPSPPRPAFTRTIAPAACLCGHAVVLYFYCPEKYHELRKQGRRFPVVANFHGGGFTLGSATDDSRWAMSVLQEVGSVVLVSVGYRRAPEHPFPTAVDDGVDALLYLAKHATELGLDMSRVALSGFSAGGNLAVTVPLRFRSMQKQRQEEQARAQSQDHSSALDRSASQQNLLDAAAADDIRIVALFCWYPILDFEQSRDHRRAMSLMPSKTLPSFLTTLFDESYVPKRADRSSPFASPVLAPDEMLADALPHDVFLYMCEWDMLVNEGQLFVRRLQHLGKKPRSMLIERAPHGWDKSPNPFRDQESVNLLYRNACASLKAIFGIQ